MGTQVRHQQSPLPGISLPRYVQKGRLRQVVKGELVLGQQTKMGECYQVAETEANITQTGRGPVSRGRATVGDGGAAVIHKCWCR